MFHHSFRSALSGFRLRSPNKAWLRRGFFLLVVPLAASACHRPHRHAPATTEEAQERAADHIEDAMDWLDASDAQTQQAKGVVAKLVPELMGFREEHKVLRTEFQKALTSPNVDAIALEDLRGRYLKLADAASDRGLQALIDVARILTPEQRQKFVEKWKKYSR